MNKVIAFDQGRRSSVTFEGTSSSGKSGEKFGELEFPG